VFLKVIGAVVSLPLLFFLPGLALVRSRLFNGAGESWVQRLVLVIGLSVAIASLLALLMAEAGYLRIWLLDLVLAAIATLPRLIFGGTPRRVFFPRPGRWELVIVIVLVALSLIMFFRPAEFVAGEGDPAYYYTIGFNIAHTGQVNVTDASVTRMSDYELGTFYVNNIAQVDPFHLVNRATGKIQPLLYHMLPVWIGIFIMLFGAFGGLYVIPVFALLGLLVIYALARRMAGVPGAAAAGLLAATFTLSVWFARIPLSEIMGAFFLMCSLLFFVDFLKSDDTLMGLASALAVTSAACVRPEAALAFVPMIVVMAVRMVTKRYRTADYVTANALLAAGVAVLVYIKVAEFDYVSANFSKVVKIFGSHANMNTFLIVMAALLAVGFVVFNLRPLQRWLARAGDALRKRTERRAHVLVKVAQGVLALLVLAAFVFLMNFGRGTATARAPQKMFINTAILFGGIAVIVFVAGLCMLIFAAEQLSFSFMAAFLVIGLSFGVQGSSLALGLYPWDSRRFMTVTVPLLLVGFGYLVSLLWKRRGVVLKVVAIVALTSFLFVFAWHDATIYNLVDYKGMNASLTQLAGKMDDDVVVFVDPYNAEVFGVALRYQHGVDARKVFILRSPRGFTRMVKEYQRQGRRVLIDTADMHLKNVRFTRVINSLVKFEPAFTYDISYPHLVPAAGSGFPKKATTQDHQLKFYYVVPRA
jgi:hypothetical protein